MIRLLTQLYVYDILLLHSRESEQHRQLRAVTGGQIMTIYIMHNERYGSDYIEYEAESIDEAMENFVSDVLATWPEEKDFFAEAFEVGHYSANFIAQFLGRSCEICKEIY